MYSDIQVLQRKTGFVNQCQSEFVQLVQQRTQAVPALTGREICIHSPLAEAHRDTVLEELTELVMSQHSSGFSLSLLVYHGHSNCPRQDSSTDVQISKFIQVMVVICCHKLIMSLKLMLHSNVFIYLSNTSSLMLLMLS